MSLLTIELSRNSWISSLAKTLADYVADYRLKTRIRAERRLLASLDDRILKDIGITRADAFLEASRSFDDVPPYRR